MKDILKSLKDPSWWFTAFPVAIVASLFASYLRDWLGSLGSLLSVRIKTLVNVRRMERERVIGKMVSNPQLLQMELSHVIHLQLAAYSLGGFVLIFPLYAVMFRNTPELWSLEFADPQATAREALRLQPFLSILAIILLWKYQLYSALVYNAKRKYKHSLKIKSSRKTKKKVDLKTSEPPEEAPNVDA